MTRALSIPDDILDLIFAMVVETTSGFWSLRACSLVCRNWNTLCKSHIFHSKTLISEYINLHLNYVFHKYRHLPPYIKCLRITLENIHLQRSLSSCMPRCFELFSGIRYLDVGGVGRFSDHRVAISEGLAILVSAPNLQRLQLKGWHLDDGFSHLTGLLRLCSNTLLHLSLEAEFDERLRKDAKVRIPVDETADMQALQTLDLFIPSRDSEVFLNQRFIQCPNLREYTARMPYVSNYPESLLPVFIEAGLDVFNFHVTLFPRLPYLQIKNTIHISQLNLHVGSRNYLYQDLFDWIKDCITELPFPSSLCGITLHLDVLDPPRRNHPLATDCQPLVDTLHHLVKNGALRHVKLKLSIVFTSDGDDADECHHRTLLEVQKGFSILSDDGAFSIPDIACRALPDVVDYL